MSELRPVDYQNRTLILLDQRVLPLRQDYLQIRDLETAARAIEDMVVRGAPAIGVCAAYTLAMEACNLEAAGGLNPAAFQAACARLARTRPTAVNLFLAIDTMQAAFVRTPQGAALEQVARDFFEHDLECCRRMGRHGAALLPERCAILTHCNAGALATAGYGTALGVIRAARELGKQVTVFADETRPWLQGARLTAWELLQDGFDVTLQVEGAAAVLMAQGRVDAVVVGADRIACNGDTANKIGTYGLAVNARYHGVPFYVAAPTTTLDPKVLTGAGIPIEERAAAEITHFRGQEVAAPGVKTFNPSFDVTPASLITRIITETGAYPASVEGIRAALLAGGINHCP